MLGLQNPFFLPPKGPCMFKTYFFYSTEFYKPSRPLAFLIKMFLLVSGLGNLTFGLKV